VGFWDSLAPCGKLASLRGTASKHFEQKVAEEAKGGSVGFWDSLAPCGKPASLRGTASKRFEQKVAEEAKGAGRVLGQPGATRETRLFTGNGLKTF
jgi:hypothetical protein